MPSIRMGTSFIVLAGSVSVTAAYSLQTPATFKTFAKCCPQPGKVSGDTNGVFMARTSPTRQLSTWCRRSSALHADGNGGGGLYDDLAEAMNDGKKKNEDMDDIRLSQDSSTWRSFEDKRINWAKRMEEQSKDMASTTKEIYKSPYLEEKSAENIQKLLQASTFDDEDDDENLLETGDDITGMSAEQIQQRMEQADAEELAMADGLNGLDEEALDMLSTLQAEEVAFMVKEADRADKARQMEEMGFSAESIGSTLGVTTSTEEEVEFEKEEDDMDTTSALEQLRDYSKEEGSFGMMVYDPELDLTSAESHTLIKLDKETGEPADGRTQMVYVDEHSCIGCTNCACVAESTFFMESDLGRARVFQQWGDDEETVALAIETCPVDCIHYVPFDELVRLEVDRRDQNINYKAQFVGGNTMNPPAGFTAPQKISGNDAPRCNNCPSRGCKNCPMYGVGLNPAFLKREEDRKERAEKRRRKAQLESQQKRAEL